MFMMSEKQDLRLLREFAQHAEACGRPLVIEIDEQVVRDEWHGFGVVEVVLDRSNPERKIELVCRTGAHSGDRHPPAVLADAGELYIVLLIEFELQRFERPAGEDGRARITDFILYDDLDPRALDTGIVHFDGRYFGGLWEICRQRGMSVVADVHVHPGNAGQSSSDREHPMISRAGHIAFILPDFARPPMLTASVGMYRYLGGKRWQTVPRPARRIFFHIGL
jgi:hypothetical protein